MKKEVTLRSHPLTGINVFLLIALFAVMSLLTVLLSVKCYVGITADVTRDSDVRIMTGYVNAKVRASDRAGCISVRDMAGRTALVLDEDGLENMIYVEDGWLCEQLCDPAEPFEPELGERLVAASAMNAQISEHLLTLTLTGTDGLDYTVVSALHTTGGDTP